MEALLIAATGFALLFFVIVIVRIMGDKPATNIKLDDISKLRSYLIPDFGVMSAWPWKPLIIGIAIGAVATSPIILLIKMRARQLACPDTRLHRYTLGDKDEIKNLVVICGVLCRRASEGREPVHLDFTFSILNMSLFQISVDSIDEFITYHESGNAYRPKLAPRLESNKARNLTFRQTGHFVVQQDFLTEAEANYILNGPIDTIFSLNSLKITVSGDELEPTLLNTDIMVKKDDSWLNYHESYFFSSGIAARNAHIEPDNKLSSATHTTREPTSTPALTPEANIVVYLDDDDNYFRLQVDHENIYRESSQPTARSAVLVQFRNEPKPPQKVGRAPNVRASVFYYFGISNTAEYRSDYPCWLNEPSSLPSFEVGMPHYLILGIFQPVGSEYNFPVYDRSEPDRITCAMSTGSSLTLNITVKLFWGEHYEFGIEKKFELMFETAGENKFFELSLLTDERDERYKLIKQSRDRVRLRPVVSS